MITITLLLLVGALVATIANAVNGRVPLWIAVLLVVIALLLRALPI